MGGWQEGGGKRTLLSVIGLDEQKNKDMIKKILENSLILFPLAQINLYLATIQTIAFSQVEVFW